MSSEVSRWQLGWDRAKSWRKVNFSTFPSHKTARIRCDWKISASSFRELLIMTRFCCTDTSGILSIRGRALPVKDKDSAPKSPEFAADSFVSTFLKETNHKVPTVALAIQIPFVRGMSLNCVF